MNISDYKYPLFFIFLLVLLRRYKEHQTVIEGLETDQYCRVGDKLDECIPFNKCIDETDNNSCQLSADGTCPDNCKSVISGCEVGGSLDDDSFPDDKFQVTTQDDSMDLSSRITKGECKTNSWVSGYCLNEDGETIDYRIKNQEDCEKYKWSHPDEICTDLKSSSNACIDAAAARAGCPGIEVSGHCFHEVNGCYIQKEGIFHNGKPVYVDVSDRYMLHLVIHGSQKRWAIEELREELSIHATCTPPDHTATCAAAFNRLCPDTTRGAQVRTRSFTRSSGCGGVGRPVYTDYQDWIDGEPNDWNDEIKRTCEGAGACSTSCPGEVCSCEVLPTSDPAYVPSTIDAERCAAADLTDTVAVSGTMTGPLKLGVDASDQNNAYKGMTIVLGEAPGGETGLITDYNGTDKTIVVTPALTTDTNIGTQYTISSVAQKNCEAVKMFNTTNLRLREAGHTATLHEAALACIYESPESNSHVLGVSVKPKFQGISADSPTMAYVPAAENGFPTSGWKEKCGAGACGCPDVTRLEKPSAMTVVETSGGGEEWHWYGGQGGKCIPLGLEEGIDIDTSGISDEADCGLSWGPICYTNNNNNGFKIDQSIVTQNNCRSKETGRTWIPEGRCTDPSISDQAACEGGTDNTWEYSKPNFNPFDPTHWPAYSEADSVSTQKGISGTFASVNSGDMTLESSDLKDGGYYNGMVLITENPDAIGEISVYGGDNTITESDWSFPATPPTITDATTYDIVDGKERGTLSVPDAAGEITLITTAAGQKILKGSVIITKDPNKTGIITEYSPSDGSEERKIKVDWDEGSSEEPITGDTHYVILGSVGKCKSQWDNTCKVNDPAATGSLGIRRGSCLNINTTDPDKNEPTSEDCGTDITSGEDFVFDRRKTYDSITKDKILCKGPKCTESEIKACCSPRGKCKDINSITGEPYMDCGEGWHIGNELKDELCEKAYCEETDKLTCCVRSTTCGSTADPQTHHLHVPTTTPITTRVPGPLTDEECGPGYKSDQPSQLYTYCSGSVCNPLLVPEDKEACCISESTASSSEDTSSSSSSSTETPSTTTASMNCGSHDCSNHANDLVSNPSTINCAGSVCVDSECCTTVVEDDTVIYVAAGIGSIVVLGAIGYFVFTDKGVGE